MSQQLFNVIFDGRVEEGMDREAVERRLTYHGLLSDEDIDDVRAGKPTVLVSGVTHDRALQYQATLEVAGARSRVEPSEEGSSPAPPSPHSVTVEIPVESSSTEVFSELTLPDLGIPDLTSRDIGTPDLAGPDLDSSDLGSPVPSLPDLGSPDRAVPDVPQAAGASDPVENRMTCPKCGFEQPESAECGACGIVIGKFLERQGRSQSRCS